LSWLYFLLFPWGWVFFWSCLLIDCSYIVRSGNFYNLIVGTSLHSIQVDLNCKYGGILSSIEDTFQENLQPCLTHQPFMPLVCKLCRSYEKL
jgi:hypothetical protein